MNPTQVLEDILAALPRETAPVKDVRVCVFWTAVTSRHCGLASTLPVACHEHEAPVRAVGRLTEMDARDLARYCLSASSLEASIGMAAVNSLIAVDEGSCTEADALALLLDKARGKRVAVVGHFPFIERLKADARRVDVLERRPRPGDRPAGDADQVLPEAEVIVLTGTSLINHSFQKLLALCRPGSFRMVVGPSTPMTPVLFDHGIDAIAGVRVVDPEAVLRTISQGAHFRAVQGVKRLVMTRR